MKKSAGRCKENLLGSTNREFLLEKYPGWHYILAESPAHLRRTMDQDIGISLIDLKDK